MYLEDESTKTKTTYFISNMGSFINYVMPFWLKTDPLRNAKKAREKLYRGKAQLSLKNLKNLFGDHWEDSLTSLEVCY